jgi:hypothetical protein
LRAGCDAVLLSWRMAAQRGAAVPRQARMAPARVMPARVMPARVMPERVMPESAVMAWAVALRSEHDDENCKRGDSV